MNSQPTQNLEVWAGLECTVNRVRDRFSDQCAMNGHDERWQEDIAQFRSLGVKKIRYPVVWEKIAPASLDHFDWTQSDRALNEMRTQGLEPIVGLVHHGSGPLYTSLLDPEFPEKLATYARAVATRYPWVEDYTPVNEPLTTARFSCLYGHWYPHAADDRSFLRALYNEIKGTVLAMREIRQINPKARLIQTDDLGRAQGTPRLQHQVNFENDRRWLSFDMLFGRVNEQHPLYDFLTNAGDLTRDELRWLEENRCPPDIIGINHYLLSNRFLDENAHLYPDWCCGGNGVDRYADVGALDTGQTTPLKPIDIFREVWERYHSPYAITEAHIAGPREAQMRWLKEIWDSAKTLREEGADLRAVTVWSLLGSYDWTTLCTADPCRQFYESGVFDVRSSIPRETAIATMIKCYAEGRDLEHPLLERPGYWQEPIRVIYAPAAEPPPSPSAMRKKKSRPLLITGANGILGQAFARLCDVRGIDYVVLSRSELDISDAQKVREALDGLKPWSVVNAAGSSPINRLTQNDDYRRRADVLGPSVLAEWAAEAKIPLMTFSTAEVFNGNERRPYHEFDETSPINNFGRSKAEGEQAVLDRHPGALVVRSSSFFGPWDERNFVIQTMRALRSGREVRAPRNGVTSPTYLPDLAGISLDLLIDGEKGVVHLTNQGAVSWVQWARRAAELAKMDHGLVVECGLEELDASLRHPDYSALVSKRLGPIMPDFDRALEICVREIALKECV